MLTLKSLDTHDIHIQELYTNSMGTYYSFEIGETIAYFLYANGIISFVESEGDEIDISLKDEMMVRVLDYIHDEELRNIKYIYNQ